MRGSSGRSESGPYKAVMYAVLLVGAIPVLLPLYWTVLGSLKSRDRIGVSPPDWLPLDVDHSIQLADQTVPVVIFDDATTSGAGVMRVKMKADVPDTFTLPRAALTQHVETEYYAQVEGVRRTVTPLADITPAAPDAQIPVELPGTRTVTTIPTDQIELVEHVETRWSVLGVEVPVSIIAGDLADEKCKSCKVTIGDDAPTIAVSPTKLSAGTPKFVQWRNRQLPAEVLSADSPGGYATIRLTSPDEGLDVPAGELRQEQRFHRYAVINGQRQPIKTLVNEDGGKTRIELINAPQRTELPAASIESEQVTTYTANVLGEPRVVEPQEQKLPDAADAKVPVFIPGALALEAQRVHTASAIDPQWQNFAGAWREQSFDLYVANTLFIAAFVVLGTILSCGLVGYAFARLEFRGRNVLFMILLATMMIPQQVTVIPQFVMYVKFGWIDSYLPLIVPHWLAFSAFFVFLFRQFLMTIPNDLEDAARIDGCGPIATWWLVMMPLSKPIIITVAVFSFTYVWNDFLMPLLYINSDEKQTVALGLQSFKTAYAGAETQLIMAASVMMIIPTILLFFAAQKAFIRGVVVSGVKG